MVSLLPPCDRFPGTGRWASRRGGTGSNPAGAAGRAFRPGGIGAESGRPELRADDGPAAAVWAPARRRGPGPS